jgi:predicted secreted protein
MPIRTRVGSTFEIELEGMAGGGYVWEADQTAGIELVRRDAVPGAGVGAGGRNRFVFRASAPGRFTLTMQLRRPWESGAVETRTFEIVATD